jgi:hypothetical protein
LGGEERTVARRETGTSKGTRPKAAAKVGAKPKPGARAKGAKAPAKPKVTAKANAAKPTAKAKAAAKGAGRKGPKVHSAAETKSSLPTPKATRPPPVVARGARRRGKEPAEVEEPRSAPEPIPGEEIDPSAAAKLDLGPVAEREPVPAHIPWSYGFDRVIATAVDPERLFVHWEMTDPAVARARRALGAAGAGAWPVLRVYDVSGRLFDGTNAHSYFDHAVDRDTRQWFFHVGKPTSSAVVEIGMKSTEGFFARIARSGRVDFPRGEPAPWGDPEWMTVRPATGDVAEVRRVPLPAVAAPPPPAGAPGGEPVEHGGAVTADPAAMHELVLRQLLDSGWERVEWREGGGEGWAALEGRSEWESPRVLSSWEAGPFSEPVTVEPPSRESWQGRTTAYRVGAVTHVVDGPWRVVVRNLGARAEREVVATWEIHRSWSIQGGAERSVATGRAPVRGGASELALGGSERRWRSGSELRLGGASERWRIGASELAWRGASERLFAGASERTLRGASERRLGGASETRLGASERHQGAADRPLPYPKPGESGESGA